MRIVLDSSVIVEGDWNLAQNDAKALLGACDRGEVELFVPRVVINEVSRAYEDRETKKVDKLNDARAALRAMRGPRVAVGELEGELKTQPGYLTHLRGVIRGAGGEIPDYPEVGHRELVERALARRRPFDGNGRLGYRDALIWHNVLDLAQEGHVLVFATSDTDFRQTEGEDHLHRHLIDDLQQRGIDPERVSLLPSLAAVVGEVLEPALYLLDELNGQLDRNEDWGRKLEDSLKDIAEKEAGHVDYTGVSVGIDIEQEPFAGEVIEETLAEVDDFSRFAIADAIPLGDGKFGIEAWLDGNAFFDITTGTGGFGAHEGVPESISISADEKTAQLSGFAEVRLVFEIEYDQGEAHLGTPRLARIENAPEEPTSTETEGKRRPRPRPIKWIELREGEGS